MDPVGENSKLKTENSKLSLFILSRDQVRRIDQLAIERYGIPGVVLMENAGRSAAAIIVDIIHDDVTMDAEGARVGVLCGGGNNGGDGYVIARHLHNSGVPVAIFAAVPVEKLTGDAVINATIAQRMHLPILPVGSIAEQNAAMAEISGCVVLVDALLGTGFRGEVRSELAALIGSANRVAVGFRTRGFGAMVAIDVPSGLDCDTGLPSNATIRADVTVTFVAMKRGFLNDSAKPFLGRVHVADIGAPKELIADVLKT